MKLFCVPLPIFLLAYAVAAVPAPTKTALAERTVNTIIPILPNGDAVVADECSNPGELICVSDTAFAICDHGKNVRLNLAAGDMRCVNKAGQVFVS